MLEFSLVWTNVLIHFYIFDCKKLIYMTYRCFIHTFMTLLVKVSFTRSQRYAKNWNLFSDLVQFVYVGAKTLLYRLLQHYKHKSGWFAFIKKKYSIMKLTNVTHCPILRMADLFNSGNASFVLYSQIFIIVLENDRQALQIIF